MQTVNVFIYFKEIITSKDKNSHPRAYMCDGLGKQNKNEVKSAFENNQLVG